MKNKAYWLKSMLFIVLFSIVNPAHAGWVIHHASGDVMYLSSGKSKEVSKDDGTWSIYDGKKGKFSIINTAKKIFWQGTVKEFCAELKQMIPQMETSLPKPKVSIKQDDSETIAGLTAQKYRLMTNGQLHKEIWIAENMALTKEMKALVKYEKELIECHPAQTMDEMVDRDPGYQGIVANGYVMKEVTYESDMPVDSDEVVSLKQKNIPASEFDVPAGYRRVQGLRKIWM